MPSLRRFRLASASALALVIGLGMAAPSAGAAASDPIDEVRERLFGGVSASSTTGGAGSTAGGAGSTGGGAGSTAGGASSTTGGVSAGSTAAGSRIGHVVDAIDDVYGITLEDDDTVPSRYLHTVDINRFGYHFGQRTAKFTIRTRDLRSVKGAQTVFGVHVVTRSRAGTDEFIVWISGTRSHVETESGWIRPCAESNVARDAARNTVTLRIPMRCLSGKAAPTSMQAAAAAIVFSDTFLALDTTYHTRRADVRR